MNSCRKPLFVFAVLPAALIVLAVGVAAAPEARSPNIIAILTDDQGWGDIGYNNPEVYTPKMDALAKEGVIFGHNYSMPQCTPTRVAMLTGRYPGRFGNAGLQAANVPVLPAGVTTLASLLKANGYETFTMGKWHMGHPHAPKQGGSLSFGFDYSYGSLAARWACIAIVTAPARPA